MPSLMHMQVLHGQVNPHILLWVLTSQHLQTCVLRVADTGMQVRVELYDVRRTKFIQAHTSALACIALSQDGKMLATASERGTLVRVHSTFDGTRLQVWLMFHIHRCAS